MKIIILRGVPGSGKSTYQRTHHPDAKVVSADHFFEGPDGSYNFNPSKLPDAHGLCMRNFIKAVQENEVEELVVDNTGTSLIEVAPYVAVGQAHGHSVEIVTLIVDPELAAARNIHGVPTQAVMKMAERLDKETLNMPPWWDNRVERR